MVQSPVLLLGSMLHEEICTKSAVDFQAEGGNVVRDWKAQKLHWNPLPETGPCCRLEIFSNLSKGLLFLFLLHSSMLFLSIQNQYCTECTQQEAKQQQKNRLTITIFLLSTQTHLFQYSEQYRITWAIGITYWADLFKKMPEEQNVKTYTLLPGERWNSVVLGNMWVKTYVWSSLEKKKLSVSVRHCVQQTDFRSVITKWSLVPEGQHSVGLSLKSYLKVIPGKFQKVVFWYSYMKGIVTYLMQISVKIYGYTDGVSCC